MISIINFDKIENSLLEKTTDELGIRNRFRFLGPDIASRDDLVASLDDPLGVIPRALIINLDSVGWPTLVTALKGHEVWKLVPTIGVGCLDDPTTVEKFYALGGASCILKPDGYEEFKKVIDTTSQFWLGMSCMPCDVLKDAA